MRILFVNTFYDPNMEGGAEQSVKLLAEGLAKAGHIVAVYCADSRDGRITEENIHGIKVYRRTTGRFHLYKYTFMKSDVGRIEKVTQKLRCYYNPECVRDFEEICDSFQPDVVHTNTLYGIPRSVWKAAHKRGIAVVHTIRDISIVSPVQYGHGISPLVVKAHQKYVCSVSKYVDAVTAPSAYTLNTSLATGCMQNARFQEVIFNSVSLNAEELHAVLAEKRSRTSPKIKFMFAGRLVYFKGIENMLRAFEQVSDRDCELHICGGGEMAEDVKRWAQKDPRIRYCGKLDHDELRSKYLECDVLLVPSVWPEPFGRVIIEGALHGMPVIAGNMGGIPEIYREMPVGRLVDATNVAELAEAMREYTHRDRFSACFDAIEQNIGKFGMDIQLSGFEDLYRRIMECK